MSGRLDHRLRAIERRSDILAPWAGVPAAQCPDAVLVAMIGRHAGWSPGYCPSDAELAAVFATAATTASTGAP